MEGSKTKEKKSGATTTPSAPVKTEAHARGRYLKIAPTKVRDLMRLVRGKRVGEAETILKFSLSRGGRIALKVLRSAEANAGSGFSKEGWVVTEARADKGPIFRRRVDPKSRGSRGLISTHSTHLQITVRRKEEKNGAQA